KATSESATMPSVPPTSSDGMIRIAPRTMLAGGRGAILIVPSEEVGGTEGMVALSLVALDFESLMAAFDRGGTKCLRGTGEVTLEPASSHGVHLHISRYE